MSFLEDPTSVDHNTTMIELQDETFCQDDKITNKFFGKKKLALTSELRQLAFSSVKKQCSYSDYSIIGTNKFPKDTISLKENMDLIIKNICIERQHFQDFINDLESQVRQLEEQFFIKSVKIDNLQFMNSEKLKIISSLTTLLNEAMWKRDTMQQICEEHVPNKLYKSMLLVSSLCDKLHLFKSNLEKLNSYLINLEENCAQTLIKVVQQLESALNECISIIESAIIKELSNSMLNEKDFNDAITTIIYEIQTFKLDASQIDSNSDIQMVNMLKTTQNDEHNLENLIELWGVVKSLFQKNQFLANRVTSLNIHKVGLQLQLDEMETSTKQLELQTMTEIEEVEKKEEILSQNESLIQQNWDEMNTSQEIVIQTHKAQEIYQQLEDLQNEYHNYKENRQLKTEFCYFKNELIEYKLKCEQLEEEIKQSEIERNVALETYAKSLGHRNVKQKIKHTGKLIKDIDTITQEIKSLELEFEKQEKNINPVVRTPVFNRTQPKSEKIPRSFGVFDANKRQCVSVFRETVVRNLRYH